MKLSFSTRGWEKLGWQGICQIAEENRFQGIEVYDVDQNVFQGDEAPFADGRAASTVRKLNERGLSVALVACPVNLADAEKINDNIARVRRYIDIARRLKTPYVRVYAEGEADDKAIGSVCSVIGNVLEEAYRAGIAILIETTGIFADTGRLRGVLNQFASDALGALWELDAPYREANESAETTITNLGAYVRHVHMIDSRVEDGKIVNCLMGEGDMPMKDVFGALRSINYDGFCSFEWLPYWMPELDDAEIIFPHYVNYMTVFEARSRRGSHLYKNNAGTGRYVWKKEALIEMTFPQVLDRMVEEFPDQYAFRFTTLDYTRTYAEFRDDVDEFARSLIALGVKPGDKVAMWATNVPQWYIGFWATTKIGAVLVTVNTAYKIHEAEYLLRQSDTHTLIMVDGYRDSNYSAIVAELCPELETSKPGEPLHIKRLPFLRNVITIGFKQAGCLTWEDAIERSRQVPIEEVRRRAANVNVHDVCNMQYTSGTTGFPKGVMLTHYNIVNNGKCIGDRMDLSTADRMMIQVPMFHCFGMVLAMTASMTHGVSIYPLPYFSPKPALACINQERITAFHGVPTMFIAMLEHPDFEKTDFSYMRTGIMAGSPCPIESMKQVVEKMNMREITIVYGQTEASPGCTMSSTDDSLEVRVATVGRALPEIECKIVNPETGEDCEDGVIGEFVARGYNIMKGYYKMPKATEEAIDADGWLHTGDLACRTPEGNYRITGRLKDMIIRGGENIYPKEIEEFIYTNPKVSDVQVIGVPDEQYGEEIMACVILKEGQEMTEAELKDFVRTHMAKHKVPRYVDFVDSFPMNAAGKILKYKMREDAIEKLKLGKAASIVTA